MNHCFILLSDLSFNVFIMKHYIQYNKLDVSAFFLIFQVGKCDPILSHNSTSQYRLKHSASFRGSPHHRSPIGRGESSSCSQISRQPIRYCIILSHQSEFFLKFNAQPNHFIRFEKKYIKIFGAHIFLVHQISVCVPFTLAALI